MVSSTTSVASTGWVKDLERKPSEYPFDEICRAIVEDKRHLLNNNAIMRMLKESNLSDLEEKFAACCDTAYLSKHPNIYQVSKIAVSLSDYTLNFLWVNLNPQDRTRDVAMNIFRDGLSVAENAECIKDPKALRQLEENERSLKGSELENWEEIKKSFTYRISRWADVNPGSQINLWYDSALVTVKAQQKTFEMMRAISQSRGVNLKLRDIRKLPNIPKQIERSLHPGTHIYYRVDILKALIADDMVSAREETAKYCVVSDIDVTPMAKEQIFDQRTLDHLSSIGYVFNGGDRDDFENSFFIFNKEKEGLQAAHNAAILGQTCRQIGLLSEYALNRCYARPEALMGAQFVYRLYPEFRRAMRERVTIREVDKLKSPRKMVECPVSQFNGGPTSPLSGLSRETFRFIGDSEIPYTTGGRALGHGESQIEALRNWKAEPLDLTQ